MIDYFLYLRRNNKNSFNKFIRVYNTRTCKFIDLSVDLSRLYRSYNHWLQKGEIGVRCIVFLYGEIVIQNSYLLFYKKWVLFKRVLTYKYYILIVIWKNLFNKDRVLFFNLSTWRLCVFILCPRLFIPWFYLLHFSSLGFRYFCSRLTQGVAIKPLAILFWLIDCITFI